MWNIFNKSAQGGEAERFLKKAGIRFAAQPDGTLLVQGNVDISGKALLQLPDLSRVQVRGDFCCEGNYLTSLKGCPAIVGGSFDCSDNRLDSLEGAPAVVGKTFFCSDNDLASLDHKPEKFQVLISDLGNLTGYPKKEMPAQTAALELQVPLKVSRPIKYRAAIT